MHRGIGLLGLGHLQKIISGHFCCAERGQMPGGLLAVDLHHACTALHRLLLVCGATSPAADLACVRLALRRGYRELTDK